MTLDLNDTSARIFDLPDARSFELPNIGARTFDTPGSIGVELPIVYGIKKQIDMQTNGWRAPDYNHILLTREVQQQFQVSRGGPIDQSCFWLDPYGASDWCSIANQAQYLSTFDNLAVDWPDWIGRVVSHHLKGTSFDSDQIDVIGLGVGDGQKETLLCGGLVRSRPLRRLRCFLLDISPTLVTEAHSHFSAAFAGKPNVESNWILGNFNHLTRYKDLFYDPEDAKILRVGTMFGGTLGNIRHEINFIEQSLRAFKSGDLLLVDVSLGFAPANRPDLIQQIDPSVNSPSGLDWLAGVLKRNRPETSDIRFDFLIKQGVSTFPNAYTIEIQATVDNKAVFSMFQKHRYTAEDFVKTFMSLGWKPLEGRQYGYQKRQLVYIFAKK